MDSDPTSWGRQRRPAGLSLRGGKRGGSPASKRVKRGHDPSQVAGGVEETGYPLPWRGFTVWRAKEMVDRRRIELPTPGFLVPCSSPRQHSLETRPEFPGRAGSRRVPCPNSLILKRAADRVRKHGFESRWSHHRTDAGFRVVGPSRSERVATGRCHSGALLNLLPGTPLRPAPPPGGSTTETSSLRQVGQE